MRTVRVTTFIIPNYPHVLFVAFHVGSKLRKSFSTNLVSISLKLSSFYILNTSSIK